MVTKTTTKYVNSVNFLTFSPFTGNVQEARSGKSLVRTRTGVPNPNWRQQVKNNVCATTSFSGREINLREVYANGANITPKGWLTGESPPRLVDYTEGCSGPLLRYRYTSDLFDPTIDDLLARNQALTRLHQAIRSQTTHFSGGTFLGEFVESVHTVRNVSKKLANLIPGYLAKQQKLTARYLGSYVIGPNGSAVRAKNVGSTLKRPKPVPKGPWKEFFDKHRKELSDNWLEFAFGVRPLVKDVHDAAETIARYSNDSRHERVRGFGESSTLDSLTVGTGFTGNTFRYTLDTRDIQKCKFTLRAGLQFAIDSPAFGSAERLRGLLGFKLEDFAPTVWNLLPYSFLVDYFVNVGDIVNCISTDLSSVRWVQESIVKTRERQYIAQGNPFPPTTGGGDLGSMTLETKLVTRGISTVGIPVPVLTIPGLTNDHGDFNQQLINMAALLGGGKGARRGF